VSDPSVVSLVHLGCARNLIDSELILGRLSEEGLMVSGGLEGAGTVVINTCSFIGPARAESEAAIAEQLERKASGEIERVVVAGCLVQRYRRGLLESFPSVDLFAEISDYRGLAKSIAELAQGRSAPAYLEAGGLRAPEREAARLLATPRSYSNLRISHGCDHDCSFCTIPSIRGPHRSKRLVDLVSEAEELVSAGVSELILVAEDSTAWGRDMGLELPQLVEALAETDGVRRVRIMYAYPNRFPWELAPLLRDHPNVATYLDIPVQHAATSMLRGMRRAGSGEVVKKTLARLQEEIPELTIRTTLLLGFPGETEEDVEEVIDLIQTHRLSRVGAFTFSPEEGTPAWELEDRVPPEVAEERHTAVLAARDAVLEEVQMGRVGERFEVIVDEGSERTGSAIARAEWDAPEVDLFASVEAPDLSAGDIIQVEAVGLDEECNHICQVVEESA
jgi:ribosomal protein S12 methylthiotransferase